MTSSKYYYQVGDQVEFDSGNGSTAWGIISGITEYALINLGEDYSFGWGNDPNAPFGKWAVDFEYLTLINGPTIKEPDESIYNDLI